MYDIAMAKEKAFFYLIDKLNSVTGETLKKALMTVPGVSGVSVKLREGLVEIAANRDVETEVRMACDVAGTTFRTRVNGKKL